MRWLFAILLLLLSILGVSACQSPESPQVEVKEKVLVVGRGGDSVSLDPASAEDGESARVTVNIFDTLVEYERDGIGVRPALAVSWQPSNDYRVWTFQLRQGVVFHDGTEFTAEAVVFNFRRWMDREDPYHRADFSYWGFMFGGYPGVVKSVEATGRYEVRITLNEPVASFLSNLAMFPFGIASPRAIKEYGAEFYRHPVGTGPFVFEEWVPNEKIVLRANRDYWGETPKVDRLIFRTIEDSLERYKELEAGSLDIMEELDPADLPKVRENISLRLLLRPSMNVGYMAINTEKPVLSNVKVRQAINHAINKDAIVDNYFGGLAKPAKNPLPPSVWGYNDAIQDYAYDPQKAKKILAQAGYPGGFKTTLWVMKTPRPYLPQPMEVGKAIQQDLAAVGIQARIVTYDWGPYIKKLQNGEHDLALSGWIGDNGDPANFLYVLLDKSNAVKGSAANFAFYKNERVHTLLVAAQTEMNQGKRAELYRRAQEIIHEDAPWVPLDHTTPPLVIKRSVSGFWPHPTGVEKLNTVDLVTKP